MEILELMRQRHSVRSFVPRPIENDKREVLNESINLINEKTGLNIQICYDNPDAFNSFLSRYGNFKNVSNYIILAGKKKDEELLGYYGEVLVLTAQELGLNTCWVGLSYSKKKVNIDLKANEKIHCVIALGYGYNQGVNRRSKSSAQVLKLEGIKPNYLDDGVEACLLAPTAVNQQKFEIICKNGNVSIVKKGVGFYINMDLGIVKCHFEMATGVRVI